MKKHINYCIICNNSREKMKREKTVRQTNGNSKKQESTVFKSNIFSFCGHNESKHKCIMRKKKNNEENPRKKHYKRKIKISKVKKLKPNLLFPPNAAVHSPFIPLSPLLRRSHTHTLTDSLTIVSDSALCSSAFASIESWVRSVLVNPKFNCRAMGVNLSQ